MPDMTPFEQRLAERLGREVEASLPAFDTVSIADSAMVRRSPWDRLLNAAGAGLALPLRPARRVALVALVALVVLAAVALAIGAFRGGGPRLAYVRANGDVVVASASGANPQVIGHVEPSPLRTTVAWAPGGGHLATFGDDLMLRVLDPSGRVTFSRALEERGSQFAWSPDGARLAVLDGAWIHPQDGSGAIVDPHLFIVSPDGRLEGETDLPPDFRYTIGQGGIAWSRDGRQLAVTGFDARTTSGGGSSSSIWVVDRATLDAHEVVRSASLEWDVDPGWLPSGRILFTRMNGGIWQVDPMTGSASVVYTPTCPCSGATIIPFALSPDRTRLAMVAPNLGLAILDLADGAVTDVPMPSGIGGDLPIGWTPDGSALTIRYGPITDEPFYAPNLGILDIATGSVTLVASDIRIYDMRTD